MKRFILPAICLFYFICLIDKPATAQVFPGRQVTFKIDSLLQVIAGYHQQKDFAATVKPHNEINGLLADAGNYPEYSGMIRLVQAFYSTGADIPAYRAKAVSLLEGRGRVLADSLNSQFYTILKLYYDGGRMEDWWPADTIYRLSVNGSGSTDALRYGMLVYAEEKFDRKDYAATSYLAAYDYYSLLARNSSNPLDKQVLMFDDWMITKSDLYQWMEMPYYQKYLDTYQQTGLTSLSYLDKNENYERLRKIDFKAIFMELVSRMKEMKKEMILQNTHDSPTYNFNYRQGYYNIYSDILNGFYDWAIDSHREGQAIIALQEYFYEDLLPNEVQPAREKNKPLAVNVIQLSTLISNLTDLYNNNGNTTLGILTAKTGFEILNKYGTGLKDSDSAMFKVYSKMATSYRLSKNYTTYFKFLPILKKDTPLPKTASADNKHLWENYMSVRLEECHAYLSMGRDQELKDSLTAFINTLDPLDKANMIYDTKGWTDLMHLVSAQEVGGRWGEGDVAATDALKELVDDIEKQQGATLQTLYPAQLLWLKALWKKGRTLSESLLSNILHYTENQLKYTFIRLNPSERMQVYQERLNPYFDVYHELLFAKKLDAYPTLRERVIAQSLYLKSAMADGNLIPTSFLAKSGDSKSLDWVERFRKTKQSIDKLSGKMKLEGDESLKMTSTIAKAQNLWLSQLEKYGMDSLTRLTDWKKISRQLKPGQVYIEAIRYSSSLTDSLARYGAYIITPAGTLTTLSLYTEKQVLELLNDPFSSPQTAALNTQSGRGTVGTSRNKQPEKVFVKGGADKLGEMLLKPLLAYTEGSKEWMLVQDGMLNRISFAALQLEGSFLFEHIQLSQLSSSSTLFLPKTSIPANSRALLVGGLNYGTPVTSNTNTLFKQEFVWDYLPGTKKEIEMLKPIFLSKKISLPYSANSFSDNHVDSLSKYNFIHLATHGFYLDSTAAKMIYADRWDKDNVRYEPLLRCGIAVSNANNPAAMKGESYSEGYLLGYELANTDLRKSYLVTLSACETGLGDIKNNLGVDGLPRALKLAGARNLLISLWKVPDEPTAIFMEKFYSSLFAGNTPARALAATQLAMSKTYSAAEWAAFVLVE